MTYVFTPPSRFSTPFGIFHNLDCPDEDTGYLSIHVFTARFSFYWSRP